MELKFSHTHNKPSSEDIDVRVKTEGLTQQVKKIDDSKIWIDFQSGNEDAFANIYKNNAPVLYCYGLKLVSDKNLIKDSIQDLFIEIWNNKHKLGKVKSIKSYLYKSFRRKLISEISKKRKTTTFLNHTSLNNISVISDELKLIEKQNFDIQLLKLNNAIDKLTDRQKEIIHLKYYAQLSYSEINEVMSLSKKGTYKLMGRAIQELKKYMSFLL